MRKYSKVIEILTLATKQQMENSLDNHLDNGWQLISIFNHNGKTYAVLIKMIAK